MPIRCSHINSFNANFASLYITFPIISPSSPVTTLEIISDFTKSYQKLNFKLEMFSETVKAADAE